MAPFQCFSLSRVSRNSASALELTIYLIYSSDIPMLHETTIATCLPASQSFQKHLLILESQLEKWLIQVVKNKSHRNVYSSKRDLRPSTPVFAVLDPEAHAATTTKRDKNIICFLPRMNDNFSPFKSHIHPYKIRLPYEYFALVY